MSTILIIDDDSKLRATLEKILAGRGHAVTTVEGGFEAAQSYREHPFDLVLTDLLMPQSGLAVIRVLRSQFPGVRVIAMSGGGEQRLDYARGLGANYTLAKPFSTEELLAAIDQTLATAGKEPVEPA
jgi:CheY-like chemotaxis protein